MMEEIMEKIDLKNLDKANWKTFRFDQIAKKISETVDPNTTDLEIYIGLEHIDSESIHIIRRGTSSDVSGGKLKCHPSDIIFGKRRAYQRKAAVVDFEGICSAHAFVLRAIPEVMDPQLFPFFLHSDLFMHCAVDISVGGLSPTINWGQLKEQEFLLPPKDQQAELAKLLWAMDEVVEGSWKTRTRLEKLKKRIAYDCYSSKEVQKMNLEDLTVKIQDGSHFSPKILFPENDGSRFRYVTSKNIRVTGIEFKEDQYVDKEFHDSIYPRCDVIKGDVLLTKDGANTGTATLNSLDEEFSLLSSVCLIRANEKTTNGYLCQYINSDIGNTNLVDQMTGTAISRLTLTTLKKIKVPIPTLEKQMEVVRKLDSIDKTIDDTIEAIISGKALQKSLINQIF
ncbi:MAG: restriction endonuclease subunit S [Bacteroidales bacterium]|nr:restriction endonuclease subunit S [Bacteroidales bacterium]MCF8457491.1 restriction endonuclease subunit S [Bacteroidales bacterium]